MFVANKKRGWQTKYAAQKIRSEPECKLMNHVLTIMICLMTDEDGVLLFRVWLVEWRAKMSVTETLACSFT